MIVCGQLCKFLPGVFSLFWQKRRESILASPFLMSCAVAGQFMDHAKLLRPSSLGNIRLFSLRTKSEMMFLSLEKARITDMLQKSFAHTNSISDLAYSLVFIQDIPS